MSLPTSKELKQLAKACRAAGITSFEGGGVKFTLSDLPVKLTSNKKIEPKQDLGENIVESDELSQEALLFWSTGDEKNQESSS